MAVATADSLRELGAGELVLRLHELKEETFNLRFQLATGQLDNNRALRDARRNIARIYTVLRERELGLSIGPDSGDELSAATQSTPAPAATQSTPAPEEDK